MDFRLNIGNKTYFCLFTEINDDKKRLLSTPLYPPPQYPNAVEKYLVKLRNRSKPYILLWHLQNV